jgi:outer membrane receptor for Fe3+-dicitrate
MSAQPLISEQVDLAEGQVVVLEFALTLQPIEIDPILVSVRLEYRQLVRNGFYDRAKSGLGSFITPEQIERFKPWRPTDLLRRVPGVRLEPDQTRIGHYFISMTRTIQSLGSPNREGCRPTVMLDGIYMSNFDIDVLPAQDIFALEVYRSPVEAPAQYAGPASACGLILVWTGKRIRMR